MALFRGQDGAFVVVAPETTDPQSPTYSVTNAVTVGQLTTWELVTNNDMQDVTGFGDDWGEHVNTIRRWTARASGFFDPAATVNHDEIMDALMPASFGGSLAGTSGDQDAQLQAHFRMANDDASGSRRVFYGNVLVQSATIRGAVGDVFRMDWSLQGSGRLNYTATGT